MIEAPSPAKYHPFHPRHPRFWRRVSLYVCTLIVGALIVLSGIIHYVSTQPERAVENILAQLPYAYRFEKVQWQNSRTLVLEHLALGKKGQEFFEVDRLVIAFTWPGLARQEILQVRFIGPQLFLSRMTEAMKATSGPSSSNLNWILQEVTIEHGTIWLENLGQENRLVPVRVGIRQPIELHQIQLNNLGSGEAAKKIQTAEIENVYLISPFDPLAPVASFPLTRVEFTYAGLWQHKIRLIQFIHPLLYLGADLFWFTDDVNKVSPKNKPSVELNQPWTIERVEVHYGQIGISAFGQPAVQFPFYFETMANQVRLDQMDKVTLQNTLHIVRFDHDYPDYKLEIKNLNGTIAFNLPPSYGMTENIVQTLTLDKLSWNGLASTHLSSTLLFDRAGIFGKFEGDCYGGKITGNIGLSYAAGFPWAANLAIDKVNVAPLSQRLAPNYLELTGILLGTISIRGKATVVTSCAGKLSLPHSGTMHLSSLHGLLSHLASETNSLKTELLNKLVSTLETYPYENGTLTADYTQNEGKAELSLESILGKRNFQVYWHPAKTEGPH